MELSGVARDGFPIDEAERWDGLYGPGSGTGRRFGLLQAGVRRRVLERRDLALSMLGSGGGARLLDLACGAGRFAAGARSQGWVWYGLDRSAPMLRRARDGKRALTQGEVSRLPWCSESAGGVLCVGILSYFRDPRVLEILAEIRRVLGPGGVAVVQAVRFDPLAYLRSRLPASVPRPLRIPGPLFPRSAGRLEALVRRAGLVPERKLDLTKFGGLPAATMLRASKPVEPGAP